MKIAAYTTPILITFMFTRISAVNADVGTEHCHMLGGWGSGHMTFGIVPMALFWIGLIVAVVILVRWGTTSTDTTPTLTQKSKSALEILKERFASGEIDKQEYEDAKQTLAD